MRVHIVEPYGSPAMRRFVEPLYAFCPPDWLITEGKAPDPAANVNMHVPWHSCGHPPTGADIALFTHVNYNQEDLLIGLKDAAHIFSMSKDGQQILKEYGYDSDVLYFGLDEFKPRKTRVGIIAIVQPNGRKREWLLHELTWNYDLSPFHFVIVGSGWDNIVNSLKLAGTSVEYHPEVDYAIMPKVYGELDVLVSAGFLEGGPLTVVEALASGVPVLAPPYGLALDFVDPNCYYYSIENLYEKLMEFADARLALAEKVVEHTYESFASQVFAACRKYAKTTRYDHITNIIRESKSTTLAEIGVAQGVRSAQMIRAAQLNGNVQYLGFDLFRPLSDEEMVREHSKPAGSVADVYKGLRAISKPSTEILLVPGDTHITLKQYDLRPDFIFLDGGHSWDTIENDWRSIQPWITNSTIVLLDDYYPNYPEGIGCQKLVDNLDRDYWDVALLDPVEHWNDDIQMVKIMRRE